MPGALRRAQGHELTVARHGGVARQTDAEDGRDTVDLLLLRIGGGRPEEELVVSGGQLGRAREVEAVLVAPGGVGLAGEGDQNVRFRPAVHPAHPGHLRPVAFRVTSASRHEEKGPEATASPGRFLAAHAGARQERQSSRQEDHQDP